MDGPRGLRADEFGALRALTDAVFRPGMPDEYPQLFDADNRDNLRVVMDDGRCVSHVGMTQQRASLFGCTVHVCCIGAVSTDREYRGRGLASACFDDAVAKAYNDGADLMIVSGDRDLYRRRGCLRVGDDRAFILTGAVPSWPDRGVTVEAVSDADMPQVMECYRREPVRFLRTPDNYRWARQSGFVMNRASDFVAFRAGGDLRGYGILQRPREDGTAALAEFAGDRHAVLAGLPEIVRQYGLTELRWQVQRHDSLFGALCEGGGLTGTPVPTSGTVKLINFPQLMDRMRPRFEEILGARDAARLSFWQDGERYGFQCEEDVLTADRDTATRLLFGTVGSDMAEIGDRPVAEALKAVLPLPTLWYGLNYV